MESTGLGGRKCARSHRSKEKVKEVEIDSIQKMPARAADMGTVTSPMRRAALSSGCARRGASAGCSAIKYQSL